MGGFPSNTSQRRREALVLVRNAVTHDARVLREARLLEHIELSPRVVGVVSAKAPEPVANVEGVRVIRLSPTSAKAIVRRLLKKTVVPTREAPATGARHPRTQPVAGTRERGSLPIRAHRWLVTLDYYRRGFGEVRRRRPALVHCNDYNTMWIGVVARLSGSAVVYDAHEIWPDRNLRPEPRWWLLVCEALFVRVAHRVITTSPEYARVMARRYWVDEPVVVRNIPLVVRRGAEGGDGDQRSSGEAVEEASHPLAVYVGALTSSRGLEESIAALARLSRGRLRLIGPASNGYRTKLEQMAEGLGVGARVEVADPVTPSEVVEAIRGADVGLALIQPACLSYELTLPNKLFEYVAAGVPILGSDLPAIAEFIETRGVGLVTDPLDPGRTAEALREILRPERSAGFREAARRAAGEETWERESKALARVYAEALEAAHG